MMYHNPEGGDGKRATIVFWMSVAALAVEASTLMAEIAHLMVDAHVLG